MNQPTVIIVNWNSWDTLSRCLDGLEKQTIQDFKVLLIDNASDQPAPVGLLEKHPRLTLIKNKTNLGFAAANNQALDLLDDVEWISLLNPDAFPEPDWLERLISAAADNPGYSMFGSRQLKECNHNILDGDGDVYHFSGCVWREGYGQNLNGSKGESREIFAPCAAAALYRKSALLSVGGFDEDFFCYVEDIDLGYRLRLMGHRCLLVPSAVVHHIGSASTGGQHSDVAVYHGHRNVVWAYVKNQPGWLFWACLPVHLLMNIVTVAVFVRRGQGRVILRAKRDAVLGLPNMWRKRREIQKHRVASVGQIWRRLNKGLGRR